MQLVHISCHYLLTAQCKCEVNISSDLTASALCKEDDELKKMVDDNLIKINKRKITVINLDSIHLPMI